ncbi:gas vesicle protein [Actinomadura sp. NBRC 104425]|uniref:GvpL/GvpF family gas vesicle protein n=1 Tax=Actinomadura sp. NBRC 104425 TaxID=3032204 RepID=UPI0024A09217|nr:GvpL/GvpF family gas vesicle protein [Actinomadura sp. NBRC 104425]GLZ11945.1 gas vesicle protein [Actinomadura sp. NBRC 104425]
MNHHTGRHEPGGVQQGTAVYLYGVARGLDPGVLGGVTGVSSAAVRAVPAGDLTALVSTVELADFGEDALRDHLEDLDWLEATARAHHEVVDRAAQAAPTAPVRIATLYRDDGRVRQVLQEQHAQFTRVLDLISGRAEWGVKIYAHSEAFETCEPEPRPRTAGGRTGTAYLRRRQAERRSRQDASRRVGDYAQSVHERLIQYARASRRHPPQDQRLSGHAGVPVLNMAYLLDDEHTKEFLDTARRADAELTGVDVEVTGPWPPYSFIDTTDTAAGDRGGGGRPGRGEAP